MKSPPKSPEHNNPRFKQKRRSLKDVARGLPTPKEFAATLRSMPETDDKSLALVWAAMVDAFLAKAISLHFVEMSPARYEAAFGDHGVLSSMFAKIELGYALGLYPDNFRDQLDRLRRIRNTFAHATSHIDFFEQTIKAECLKFDPTAITPGSRPKKGVGAFDPTWGRDHYLDIARRIIRYFFDYVGDRSRALERGEAARPVSSLHKSD